MPDEKETVIAIAGDACLCRISGGGIDEANDPAGIRDHIEDRLFGINRRQKAFLKDFVEKYSNRSILDVSYGNGDMAVLLAGWCKKVATLEHNPAQVEKVHLKSVLAGVNPTVSCGDIRDLSSIYKEKFNLITCLRNSLPRLINETDIWGTLAQIYLQMEPEGILLIQTLNYDCLFQENSDTMAALKKYYNDLDVNVFFDRGQGKSGARLIYRLTDFYAGRKKELEYVIPVRPIFQKELNIWLAELGYERINNYCCFTKDSANVEPWEVLTVAFRPCSSGNHQAVKKHEQ